MVLGNAASSTKISWVQFVVVVCSLSLTTSQESNIGTSGTKLVVSFRGQDVDLIELAGR